MKGFLNPFHTSNESVLFDAAISSKENLTEIFSQLDTLIFFNFAPPEHARKVSVREERPMTGHRQIKKKSSRKSCDVTKAGKG